MDLQVVEFTKLKLKLFLKVLAIWHFGKCSSTVDNKTISNVNKVGMFILTG